MRAIKTLAFVTAVFSSQMAFSAGTTWTFYSADSDLNNSVLTFIPNEHHSTWYDGNTAVANQDGVTLTVSAWSDTWDSEGEDLVRDATLAYNSYGLLNYNRDEPNGNSGRHYVDSKRDSDPDGDKAGDTDMLLFSFSKAVSLTKFWFGAAFDGGNKNQVDVSVAAFQNTPTLEWQTWGQVAESSFFSTSLGNLIENPNNAALSESNGNVVSFMKSNAVVEAKYWLIGAYSSVFGALGNPNHPCCEGNDGFKFKGLTAHMSTQEEPANAPATLSLALLGGYIIFRRKIKKI